MQDFGARHIKSDGRNGFLNDGKVAVGAILGLLVGLAFGAYSGILTLGDDVTSIISLLVAGSSVYVAGKALSEQRKVREASTDPLVIAHFGQREDAPEVITFNLSNVGGGAAVNVEMWIDDCEKLASRDLLSSIFKTQRPISTILQGKSTTYSLEMGWELIGGNPLPPFSVRLGYEDLDGNKYSTNFELDVHELAALDANTGPLMRGVSALEKIARKL